MRPYLILIFALLAYAPAFAAEKNGVAVSIKPIYSLVAGVMEGDGEPLLIVQGNTSPHVFNLKPSQVKALMRMDVVFYIDDHFELFLHRVFKTLPENTQRVALTSAPGVALIPAITEDKTHGTNMNMHIWMDPGNAIAMTRRIEAVLSETYPEKRMLYKENAKKLIARLEALDDELRSKLAKAKGVPLVFFHDAYQYFTHTYGLNAVATITKTPEQLVSAKHLVEVKTLIQKEDVKCIFHEPGIDPKVLETVGEGKKINSIALDPEAIEFLPEKDLYFSLMRRMAENLEFCLSQ